MDNKMCAIELIALSISKQDEKRAREEAARQEALRREQEEMERRKKQSESLFNEVYAQLERQANRGEVPQATFLVTEMLSGDYRAVKQVTWRYKRPQGSNETDYELLYLIDTAYLIKLFNDLCFECVIDESYDTKQDGCYSYGWGAISMVKFIVKPQPECFSLLGE